MNTGLAEIKGIWRLVSFEQASGDRISYPFGTSPLGTIVYSEEGWMCVQIEHAFPNGTGKAEGQNDPAYLKGADAPSPSDLAPCLAYQGTYEVDTQSKSVLHKIHGSNYSHLIGQTLIRFVAMDDGVMTLHAPAADGISAKLVWKKSF